MNTRIAEKIINGDGNPVGPPRWTFEQYTEAHRAFGRYVGRCWPLVPAKTSAALAIRGSRYLTADGCYLYFHDTDADRWILPMIKTDAQERGVRAQFARLAEWQPSPTGATRSATNALAGKTIGAQLITDGDAFLATVAKTWQGKPIVLGVNFHFDGAQMRHQTVAFAPEDYDLDIRARAMLQKMHDDDPLMTGHGTAIQWSEWKEFVGSAPEPS